MNKIFYIALCYQFTKNMKYLGPKASVNVKHNRKTRPIIQHHLAGIEKMFEGKQISKTIAVGFEADRVLRTFDAPVGYTCIIDHVNTNHGKVLKDILVKYNPKSQEYSGCFIVSDISVIPKITNLNIDLNKNYIFYTDSDSIDTDITCNIQNDKIEYMLYNTSTNYWTGMLYLSNESVRVLRHINMIQNTDPLFLLEVINHGINSGIEFEPYKLKKKDFTYIHNNSLKPTTKAI